MTDGLDSWYKLDNNRMIPQPGDPPGAKITSGPSSWQVLQRGSDGTAEVMLSGFYVPYPDVPVDPVMVRVAREYDDGSVPGCDWQEAETLAGRQWRITLRVPTGGLYRIDTALGRYYAGDRIIHIAVGDIWVIGGQSNAVGYGHGRVVDPPMLGVSVFGMDEQWQLAAHPIFNSAGTKHPANYDTGWVAVSPWLSFGKVVLERAGVPIGLIPAALGGSPLAAWDSGDPGGDEFLFRNMNSTIEAAGGKIAGMAWYQGCTETHMQCTAEDYLERFKRFVAALRVTHGKNLPIITAQLNRYTEAPPERQEPWSLVRDAQRRAAREIPNLAVILTLDIQLTDGVHNSAGGNVQLGQRFALAALGMVYGEEVDWQAPDIRSARFTGVERDAIRMDFDHVHGDFWMIYVDFRDDFRVRDEAGLIPIAAAKTLQKGGVVLELARPAVGKTFCSCHYGGNPKVSLRDEEQRPILAFHNVPVEDVA